MTLVSKVACVPAVILLGLMCWSLTQPAMSWLVILSCVLLGIASLGIYPIMLELSVECTFPLDESVVTGLCYLSSALQVQYFNLPCLPRDESIPPGRRVEDTWPGIIVEGRCLAGASSVLTMWLSTLD
jgi:hypothetical protein